jgi:hypothetical protein
LRDCPFVTWVAIEGDNDAPLPGLYDTILPRGAGARAACNRRRPAPAPRATAGRSPGLRFHSLGGDGLDTVAALRDRLPALQFVLDNFETVEGRVTADGSDIRPSVVRKR